MQKFIAQLDNYLWNRVDFPLPVIANTKVEEEDSLATKALSELRDNGISYELKNNGMHAIVECEFCKIDYWPSTGKWRGRNGDNKGHGVKSLITYVLR